MIRLPPVAVSCNGYSPWGLPIPVLEAAGFRAELFPANGRGGRLLEAFVRDGKAAGVLDLCLRELLDELFDSPATAGPDRLTAAAIKGVPQVIGLGGLDAFYFITPDDIPARYRNLPNVLGDEQFVRTTAEDLDALGKEIAQKASAAAGPTRILIPLRGLSQIDRAGGPAAALFQSLRNWTYPSELLVELDMNAADEEYAAFAARELVRLIGPLPR